jgi:hypothetical protein
MSELRIEFTERYVIPPDEDEVETAKNLKLPRPKGQVKYRRIYPRLSDILQPIEIPGISSYCQIEYTSGYIVDVKGSYDDIVLQIDDRGKLEEND